MGKLSKKEYIDYIHLYNKLCNILGTDIADKLGYIVVMESKGAFRIGLSLYKTSIGFMTYDFSVELTSELKVSKILKNEIEESIPNEKIESVMQYLLNYLSSVPYVVNKLVFRDSMCISSKEKTLDGYYNVTICSNKSIPKIYGVGDYSFENYEKLVSLIDDRGHGEAFKNSFRESMYKDLYDKIHEKAISFKDLEINELGVLINGSAVGTICRDGGNYYVAYRVLVKKVSEIGSSDANDYLREYYKEPYFDAEVFGETFYGVGGGFGNENGIVVRSQRSDLLVIADSESNKYASDKNYIRVEDMFNLIVAYLKETGMFYWEGK